MNYIKELNAFKDWLLTNEIPTSAIVLWYTLMAINNSVGWKNRFNAPNSLVGQLTGLSKQGLLDARKKLVEHNLIACEKGKKEKLLSMKWFHWSTHLTNRHTNQHTNPMTNP